MPHFIYLARCADDSLYAGTCIDLAEREKKHNAGTGAKYTRSRLPLHFVYHETFRTLGKARSREAAIKKLTKEQKESLILLQKKRQPRTVARKQPKQQRAR